MNLEDILAASGEEGAALGVEGGALGVEGAVLGVVGAALGPVFCCSSEANLSFAAELSYQERKMFIAMMFSCASMPFIAILLENIEVVSLPRHCV